MDAISLYTTNASTEAQYGTERLRRQRQEASNVLSPVDSVSFSEEALELAAALTRQREQSEAADDSAADSGNNGTSGGTSGGASSDAGKAAGSGGAGGAGGAGGTEESSESESQISKLEESIADLEAKVQNIMSGAGSPESKTTQAQPFLQQINSLRQQLEELKSQMTKKPA